MSTRNTGRKYHHWGTGKPRKDGSLVTQCQHCGLKEHTGIDPAAPWKRSFLSSTGKRLSFGERPDCPREPTY